MATHQKDGSPPNIFAPEEVGWLEYNRSLPETKIATKKVTET